MIINYWQHYEPDVSDPLSIEDPYVKMTNSYLDEIFFRGSHGLIANLLSEIEHHDVRAQVNIRMLLTGSTACFCLNHHKYI